MPDAAVYGPPSLDKALGSLPVVASFLEDLNVAGIIDGLCPVRDVALATHSQVIEAMIANRLTSPTPLVRVIDWARAWAVGHCFGISPQVLNDDRLGRALDAIAPRLDQIAGTVGATAITRFGLDVSQIHWDMTSISLYGAYEQADADYAQPRYGHPKDRRPDLKQIQTGIGTSADGGIPVFHRAYDGGAAEVSQVTGAMTALKDMAGQIPARRRPARPVTSRSPARRKGCGGRADASPADQTRCPGPVRQGTGTSGQGDPAQRPDAPITAADSFRAFSRSARTTGYGVRSGAAAPPGRAGTGPGLFRRSASVCRWAGVSGGAASASSPIQASRPLPG